MYRIFYAILLSLIAVNNYAWNAMGHQIVAQIAYDNLTPAARKMCDQYLQVSGTFSSDISFVKAASWLDEIRRKNVHKFDSLHYVDIPFAKDKSHLPLVKQANALWGVQNTVAVLSSKNSSAADKALSLRILIHLIGDIHQPLHTVTKVSRRLPKGDLGGNLFYLARNPLGKNLHQYWDNGAGFLSSRSKKNMIKYKAFFLERKWPCSLANLENDPQQWIQESHQIALTQVYTLTSHKVPSRRYRYNAQEITQKQLLFAGCRLARLLNGIAQLQYKS